jgi:hypothetical protein
MSPQPENGRVIVFSDVPPLGNEGVSMSVLAHRLTACLGSKLDHLVTRRYSRKYTRQLIGHGLQSPVRVAWDAAACGLRFLRGGARVTADLLLMSAWARFSYPQKRPPLGVTEIIGLSGPHWHFLPRLRAFASHLGLPFTVFIIDDYEITAEHAQDTRARTSLIGEHLRAAHRVLAISPGMAERLHARYNITAEVLYPVADEITAAIPSMVSPGTIAYVGSLGPAYIDSLTAVARMIAAGDLSGWTLRIISRDPRTFALHLAGTGAAVLLDDCDREQLREQVATAEVQLVPYSFDERWRITAETSFPSKFMDGVISGRPVIVFAPAYASISRHLIENDCPFVATDIAGVQRFLNQRPWAHDDSWREAYCRLTLRFHSASVAREVLTGGSAAIK